MAKKLEYYKVTPIERVKDVFEIAAREDGDKTAFMFRKNKQDYEVTYKELLEEIKYLGTSLCEMGMEKMHIANIGPNSYDWVNVYMSVVIGEGVYVPIDKELPLQDIINIVNDSDSEVFFYTSRYEKDFMENADQMPNIKYFIGIDREEDEGKFLSYKKFKEMGKKLYLDGDRRYDNLKSDLDKLKILVYTSGTTGKAKGVMLSERNVVANCYYGLQVATIYTKCLSVLPMHHTYEGVIGLMASLHLHTTICICSNLKAIVKDLPYYKPDYIFLVPAFLELFYKKIWANIEKQGKGNLIRTMIKVTKSLRKVGIDLRRVIFKQIHEVFGGSLREIVCGGAPIRPEIAQFFTDIGVDVINGYGITECSPLVSVNRSDFMNDPTTVGFVLPNLQIDLRNKLDDGQGEICVKGDSVMLGYYKQPELTAEVLEDGWFNTGDYGMFNDKNQLMITGRKKNLIVLRNGKNIFPEELEDIILSIPYVMEAVVYSIKDKDGLEDALGCQVFLSEESVKEMNIENPNEQITKDIAEKFAELPAYKHMSEVIVRDHEFVKTTTNKIKRNCIDQ